MVKQKKQSIVLYREDEKENKGNEQMKTFTELKKFVMDLDDDVRDMYSIDQEIVEIMDKENLDEVTAISKFIQRARRQEES